MLSVHAPPNPYASRITEEEIKVMMEQGLDGMLPVERFRDLFPESEPPEEESGSYHTLSGFILMRLGGFPRWQSISNGEGGASRWWTWTGTGSTRSWHRRSGRTEPCGDFPSDIATTAGCLRFLSQNEHHFIERSPHVARLTHVKGRHCPWSIMGAWNRAGEKERTRWRTREWDDELDDDPVP